MHNLDLVALLYIKTNGSELRSQVKYVERVTTTLSYLHK